MLRSLARSRDRRWARRPEEEKTATKVTSRTKSEFVSDLKAIRQRARTHVERGAVTEGYRADRETVLTLLNETLDPRKPG